MNIGNISLENNIFLAPMAGFTDLPFRLLCREYGCGLVFTEMVSAKGIVYENDKTNFLLETNKKEKHVAVQLFGKEPEILAEAVKKIEHLDFDFIDINMGCPAPKIVKNGEGAALLQNPILVGKIINSVVKSTKKPITIKIRKGFCKDSVNACEIAKIAEYNGALAITIHARTREDYYKNNADLEIIKKVKDCVKIKVIGNGDINCPQDAKNMLQKTGCDGVMIGRAAQGNPFIFRNILDYLEKNCYEYQEYQEEIFDVAIRHAKLLIKHKGEFVAMLQMRKHAACYIKKIEHASKIRNYINKIETLDELISIFMNLKKN